MGANNWTPEQWRAYNARTGDRHVNRALPPISRAQVLREDVAQQAVLYRLSRRREDDPARYLATERAWIHATYPGAADDETGRPVRRPQGPEQA